MKKKYSSDSTGIKVYIRDVLYFDIELYRITTNDVKFDPSSYDKYDTFSFIDENEKVQFKKFDTREMVVIRDMNKLKEERPELFV